MRAFNFHRSESVEDALAHHDPESAYLAGGTTLLDLVKLDVMLPGTIVDVNRLPLNLIERVSGGGLRIGALVRNSDLAWHPDVQRDYPLITAAIMAGATAQLRNMATTGGNIMQRTRCPYFRDGISACNKRTPGSGCAALDGFNRSHALLGGSEACIATHPSDLCVALAALEAEIHVEGRDGPRTIPFGEFHLLPGRTPQREHALDPGELITGITLPPLPAGAKAHYIKLRDRESFEFALASAGVVLVVERNRIQFARVALGGIATKPWRATTAEAVLRGAIPDADTFRAAAETALREAQPRAHNAFKLTLARQALVRALETASGVRPAAIPDRP